MPESRPDFEASEARFRTLFQYAQVGVVLADARSVYSDANRYACEMFGYTRDEFIGLHASDIVVADETPHVAAALSEIRDDTDHRREWRFRRKDGTIFHADVVATSMPDGTLLGMIRDVSSEYRAEEYQAYLASIVESSRDAIIGEDMDGCVTSWNTGARGIFGYTAAEMVGRPLAVLVPEERRGEEQEFLERVRRGERAATRETVRRTRDGRLIDVTTTVSPIRGTNGGVRGLSHIARDVTMIRAHEREVVRLSQLYAALSHVNQAIAKSDSRDVLLARVCEVLVEFGAFSIAWIGRHDAEQHRLVPVAVSGDRDGYLGSVDVRTDDTPRGSGAAGLAFNTGRAQVFNDVSTEAAAAPWRAELMRRGLHAAASLPVRAEGSVWGTLTVYSSQLDVFNEREIALLNEAANDISFALDNLARAEAHRGAELKIRSEEEFSAAMIDSMPGVVYVYDEAGRFLRWNRNFEQLSGYSAEEIVKMHPLDFFRGDERDLVAARISEVFARGASAVQASLVAKDGTKTPCFFTGRRVELQGRSCLAGVGVDVSDRIEVEELATESEEKYRELVELASSIILRWTAEGRIQFLNDYGLQFFGYREEEIFGRLVTDTIVPATETGGRNLLVFIDEVTDRPESFATTVNENVRRNGERVWISWANRVVRDESGRVAEILSVGTDITAQRRTEEQLRQSQKMDAIGRLAGGVAHDFNNMLTVITGSSEFLLAGELAGEDREALVAIREASERATSLTRQLLGFSRQTILQPRTIDLNIAVGNITGMLSRLIGADVELIVTAGEALHSVLVDPSQVDQILMNLAVNARDAMPRGGRLIVETSNVTLSDEYPLTYAGKAGPNVLLAVTDSGVGIPRDVQPRVFEPFFTTKGVGKGTGLGLSMILGIVQQSNGSLDVFSEVGRGTSFKLYFPAADKAATTAVTGASVADPHGSETVLLVEDEPGVREFTTRCLQRRGYTVVVAEDPTDAMAMLDRHDSGIDMLIADVVMPKMSGPQLAAAIRATRPELKVLFVSGYTDDAVVRHGLLEARAAFLQKPFTPGEFARKVRDTLDRQLVAP
jgi:PAS domain S-box-containing protein